MQLQQLILLICKLEGNRAVLWNYSSAKSVGPYGIPSLLNS